ncbi:MAG: hypothetical protein QOG62_1980 [Thermoleophilaceae bacterium]|jgi:hypothetical protein|nr:hypothetical protein [Thermoleophilaceae bacterium]
MRDAPIGVSKRRRMVDRALAVGLLALEVVVLATLWGPQPVAWLWVGSQADFQTGSVEVGIVVAFTGMLVTLFGTLVVAKQIDHGWKLVRRASGIKQEDGMLERLFVVSIGIGASAFTFWLFVIHGPGSSLWSAQAL